jgi:hypothetical protein
VTLFLKVTALSKVVVLSCIDGYGIHSIRCFIRVIFSVSNSIEEKKMKQTFVLLKTKRQLSLLFRPRIDNGWGWHESRISEWRLLQGWFHF